MKNNTVTLLEVLGIPARYRARNPFTLPSASLVDAFPKVAHPDSLQFWVGIQKGAAFRGLTPVVAWPKFLIEYETACRNNGKSPYAYPAHYRGHNSYIRRFLVIWRKRIRLELERYPFLKWRAFAQIREYTVRPNSWVLHSAFRVTDPVDRAPLRKLSANHWWIKTRNTRYPGESWHRWLLPGVARIGVSWNNTNIYVWYEITCPYIPKKVFTEHQFITTIDRIWNPIIRALRWKVLDLRKWRF